MRIKLQVGILDQHNIACGILEAEPHCRALAQVDDGDMRMGDESVTLLLPDDVGAAIGGPVVNNDNLLADARQLNLPHASQHLANRLRLVVHGDDDR